MLTAVDYAVIGAYIASVIIIGCLASRRQSAESFLISERRLGVLSGISTINATKTGAIIFVFTALLYSFGFSAIWYFIGIVLGYLAFLPFAASLFKKSNARYYTLAQYFRENWGPLSGAIASAITIVTMAGFLIINLIAAAKVLGVFAGTSFHLSAVFVAVIVLLYLLLAGFAAVVKTDVLQYAAIVFLLVSFAIVLSAKLDIPAAEWTVFSTGGVNIFGFLLLGVLLPFASPDLWQRVYAMPNQRVLKRSIFFSIIVFLAVAFVLSLVGLFVKTAMPAADPDLALIYGLAILLPPGFSGLAVVVFFAALMSSIDTYAYTASSALVQDFFGRLSKERTVLAIRCAIFAFIAASTAVSILVQDLIRASFMFAAFVVVLAVAAIATWLRPQIRRHTINFALIAGCAVLIAFIIIGVLQDSLTPAIVTKAIAGSLLGLIAGAAYSSWAFGKTKSGN